MSLLDIRDQLRERYGSPAPLDEPDPVEVDDLTPERAFVVHADSGRTVITAPLREIASKNAGFTYLRGRFVEADSPNGNGAMWTTEDLQLGEASIAGGPLNWLHQEKKVIGALLGAELVHTREAARHFSTDQRKKMAGKGQAMSNESFPIANAEDLHNAIRLAGNAKDPAAARRHIIRRARALGLTKLIPDTWKTRESAAHDVGNHIVADAAVWRFLYPQEADTIERAAADMGAYYSMECLSRQVACIDSPGRPGCGEVFSYSDYDGKRACAHLNERSSVRRFIDPLFLGGAIIVPPVLPGWDQAEVAVVRQAAALSEQYGLADDGLSRTQAESLTAAILTWANR